MLQDLLKSILTIFFAVAIIGLALAMFFIGLIALWYLLLIGTGIWIIRRLYRAWQARHSGPIQADGVEIILHEEQQSESKASRHSRVIDHE